jgi:hypothetical protein
LLYRIVDSKSEHAWKTLRNTILYLVQKKDPLQYL